MVKHNIHLNKMESHAQSVDDVLSASISFKLRPGASYVIGRNSITLHPSGGNDYSSSGIRVMKFNLNSEGWCDPSTLNVFMEIHTHIYYNGLRSKTIVC